MPAKDGNDDELAQTLWQASCDQDDGAAGESGVRREARRLQEGAWLPGAIYDGIYLRIVDENGTQVRINAKNEIAIYPYKAAADEHGV